MKDQLCPACEGSGYDHRGDGGECQCCDGAGWVDDRDLAELWRDEGGEG